VHDWFPGQGSREFVLTVDVCTHCNATRVNVPWGQCLSGHPIGEHYTRDGRIVALDYCERPQ
jgi:hypothetical protein